MKYEISLRLVFFVCFLLPYLALTLVCGQMAWLRIFFYVDTQEHAILSCLDPFYSYLLIPEERKNYLV